MKLIALIQVQSRESDHTVYINPECVESIVQTGRESYNSSLITLKTGEKIAVKDYPSTVAKKLTE